MGIDPISLALIGSAGVTHRHWRRRQPHRPRQSQSKPEEMEANRANQRTANAAASAMPNQGLGGTMLTGPQGVDPNALSLGRNTLLGQ